MDTSCVMRMAHTCDVFSLTLKTRKKVPLIKLLLLTKLIYSTEAATAVQQNQIQVFAQHTTTTQLYINTQHQNGTCVPPCM